MKKLKETYVTHYHSLKTRIPLCANEKAKKFSIHITKVTCKKCLNDYRLELKRSQIKAIKIDKFSVMYEKLIDEMRTRRIELNYSLRDLAKILEVSHVQILDWENGIRPRMDNFILWCVALDYKFEIKDR